MHNEIRKAEDERRTANTKTSEAVRRAPYTLSPSPYTKRYFAAILLLVGAIVLSYAIPRAKYTSPDMLSKLVIPRATEHWRSRDISNSLKTAGQAYFFINKIFARQYVNDLGEPLTFLILDAGNFHHPKVCFGASGYTVVPLEDVTLEADAHKFKAHVLHMQKGRASILMLYWMCIDKKPVGWFGQKFIQFFYSMANKQKIGLMGRLEIPVPSGNIESALGLAKSFIRNIAPGIPAEQADYLFGKN